MVEQGTHSELVEKRGHLFELLEAQKLGQQTAGKKSHAEGEVHNEDDACFHTDSKKSVHETTEDATTQSNKLTTSTLHLLRFLFMFNRDDKHILLGALVGCVICGLAMPTHSCKLGIASLQYTGCSKADGWSLACSLLRQTDDYSPRLWH